MILNKLTLTNFRNYDYLEASFKKGINIIYGRNGKGKSNLIEAIYYLSNLGSFRTSNDKDLINKKSNRAYIEGDFSKVNCKVEITQDKKILQKNDIQINKHRDYIGEVNVIGFFPNEVYLLQDLPKTRRKFLDKEISKIDKKYMMDILIFNKLIKERNEILRSSDKYKKRLIEVIDKKIAIVQERVIDKKREFLKKVEDELIKLTLKNEYRYPITEIEYKTFVKGKENVAEEIVNIYQKNYLKDEESGMTNYSIKKDDFEIKSENLKLSSYASQGEQRFLILMLKMAIIKVVERISGEKLILLLDDVFLELDKKRKMILIEALKDYEQVFITGSDYKDVKPLLEKFEKVLVYEIQEDRLLVSKEE